MSVENCPYCRAPFEPDEEIVACPACATRHHADCLQENGGCAVFGCSQGPADEATVSITTEDLSPPPLAPRSEGASHTFLHLSASAPGVVAPPPPPLTGGVPPPPPPRPQINPMPALTFAGYAPPAAMPASSMAGSYAVHKSRIVFVLLAIFLGAFGGHNFYAGYVRKAVVQLCLTIFTCFACSIVSWIWAIVEACMVNCDDDGVAFV
jgi:TM2 domain-containing membrane protein YozV